MLKFIKNLAFPGIFIFSFKASELSASSFKCRPKVVTLSQLLRRGPLSEQTPAAGLYALLKQLQLFYSSGDVARMSNDPRFRNWLMEIQRLLPQDRSIDSIFNGHRFSTSPLPADFTSALPAFTSTFDFFKVVTVKAGTETRAPVTGSMLPFGGYLGVHISPEQNYFELVVNGAGEAQKILRVRGQFYSSHGRRVEPDPVLLLRQFQNWIKQVAQYSTRNPKTERLTTSTVELLMELQEIIHQDNPAIGLKDFPLKALLQYLESDLMREIDAQIFGFTPESIEIIL
jgi:hypothetical protein